MYFDTFGKLLKSVPLNQYISADYAGICEIRQR